MLVLILSAITLFAILADRDQRDHGPVRIICPICHRDCSVAVYALHIKTHD